jgi:uncharacterized protein with HEPN domain
MNNRRLIDYIDHMLGATQLALSYVEGMAKEDFLQDSRTQQAVVLNILVIGETATKLLQHHSDFLQQFPGVPWPSMKGMRNRIAHGYFEIDMDVVWETVKQALPQLLQQLPAVHKAAKLYQKP